MTDPLEAQVIEAGRLLVANPLLPDPNFDRTVVLLLACNDEGALGLVLNRPSGMEVASPLPRWEQLAAAPAVVFVGGPVQHQAVICLARPAAPAGEPDPRPGARPGGEPDREPESEPESDADAEDGWKPVTSEVGTLDLELDPEALADRFRQVRVFAGYAGWSAGQLEAEVEAGAWWLVDAEPEDPFSGEPDELWSRVLRRQPNKLALVAYYPDDPSSN